jgi:hypothetical protein
MKALGVLAVTLMLSAAGLLASANPAVAQSSTDVPTGSGFCVPAVTEETPAPPTVSMLQLDYFYLVCRYPFVAAAARWLSLPQAVAPSAWTVAAREPQNKIAWRRSNWGARVEVR